MLGGGGSVANLGLPHYIRGDYCFASEIILLV